MCENRQDFLATVLTTASTGCAVSADIEPVINEHGNRLCEQLAERTDQ